MICIREFFAWTGLENQRITRLHQLDSQTDRLMDWEHQPHCKSAYFQARRRNLKLMRL